jgi:hypothetical protein
MKKKARAVNGARQCLKMNETASVQHIKSVHDTTFGRLKSLAYPFNAVLRD